MDKERFLAAVGAGISLLPPEDIARSLEYYREMIQDRMEEGMTEEEAVAAMGTVDEVVAQIMAEAAPPMPEPPEPEVIYTSRRRVSPGVIILLVLGSPVWLPLVFAAVVVALSLLFALVMVVFGFAVGGVAAIVSGVTAVFTISVSHSMLYIGVGLVLTGLAMLLEEAAKKSVTGVLALGRRWTRGQRR